MSLPQQRKTGVHSKHVVCSRNLFKPGLDFRSLVCVLLSRHLDPALRLADRDRREVEIRVRYAAEASEHRAM